MPLRYPTAHAALRQGQSDRKRDDGHLERSWSDDITKLRLLAEVPVEHPVEGAFHAARSKLQDLREEHRLLEVLQH
ncbi:unnamed protein product [Sphagnum balticum]